MKMASVQRIYVWIVFTIYGLVFTFPLLGGTQEIENHISLHDNHTENHNISVHDSHLTGHDNDTGHDIHDGNQTHHHHNSNHSSSHHGSHGVHVASWNFPYVSEPLIFCLFIMAVALLKLFFHYVECLSAVVPESCLLIIFGISVGAILQYAISPATNSVISADSFSLEPRMFMLFLLPPVVLDSAYSLNDKVFADNLGTILVYAVIVLAIFQEIGVNNVLYFLVFGESLLNDAVTVVLYNMMKAFNGMETIPPEQMVLGVVSFFTVSLGGLAIGILIGILTCFLTRITGHIGVYVVEPLVLLVMAYLSFLCAELVHWSGIISMIGCGLVQSQYSFHNVSEKSLVTVNYFVKMLGSLSDAVIFLFLGLEVIRTQHVWHTGFVICSLLLCLLCRLISVLGLTLLANITRSKPIALEEQFIMWYGGLRGAVCFALCATLSNDFEFKNMFLTSALVIVFFTVFIQGITIKPLVSLLKITRKEEKTQESIAVEFQVNVTEHVMEGVECIIGNIGENTFNKWLGHVDRVYMRRILQTNPKTKEEEFLEVYQKIAVRDHVNHIYESTSKVVAINEMDEDFDEHLTLDDRALIPNEKGKKGFKEREDERQMNDSELKKAMGKAFNSTFGGKKLDKNMTGTSDAANMMAKLKAKHARLQENKLLRSPTPSRQGSFKTVKSPKLKQAQKGNNELSPDVNTPNSSQTKKIQFTSVSSYDSTRDDMGDVFDLGISAAQADVTSGPLMRPIPEESRDISWIGWNPPGASTVPGGEPRGANNQSKTNHLTAPQYPSSVPSFTDELVAQRQQALLGMAMQNGTYGSQSLPHPSSYPDVPITRMPLRTDLRSVSPANMFGRTNSAFIPDDRQLSHRTVISLVDEGQGYCTVVRVSEDGTTTSTQTKM